MFTTRKQKHVSNVLQFDSQIFDIQPHIFDIQPHIFDAQSHIAMAEEMEFDGDEADTILARSSSRWQGLLENAMSMPAIPACSLRLQDTLSRIPSFPDIIPPGITCLEGFSSWENSNPTCQLTTRIENTQRLPLRGIKPIVFKISTSSNFLVWEGSRNNGIALLVLGWAYILSASLAERQDLCIIYKETSQSYHRVKQINLDYASSQELAWWRAITRPGIGWSIQGDQVAPWAIYVEDLGLEVLGNGISKQSPTAPTASQAAQYLDRLCRAFGLGTQRSAALAAALSLPLHSTAARPTIELPKPSLSSRVTSPENSKPPELALLNYYMTLSLSPRILGSSLWSVFWEPDVPCNFAGAWVGPILAVLGPIIQDNNLELLAKVLSATRMAPLWLGITLCGRQAIINSITPSLRQGRSYSHTQPNIDAAAWTNAPQSFMDTCPKGPIFRKGRSPERTSGVYVMTVTQTIARLIIHILPYTVGRLLARCVGQILSWSYRLILPAHINGYTFIGHGTTTGPKMQDF